MRAAIEDAACRGDRFGMSSPTLATRMGLGVGIDYALFLTTRHRQQLIDGHDAMAPRRACALRWHVPSPAHRGSAGGCGAISPPLPHRAAEVGQGDERLAQARRARSCAALIMTSVFFAFLLSSSVVIKMLALGLGASVIIDATVIRLLIVPSPMFVFDRANRWIPGWLDRILPRLEPEPAPAEGLPAPAYAAESAGME